MKPSIWWCVAACAWPASGLAAVIGFDADPVGAAPPGWTVGMTGRGQAQWAVAADPSAPTAPNVLRQSGRADFPWIVTGDGSLADGYVEVKFKPLAGKDDQAIGVRVLSSNGEVRRAVAAGDCALGLVDTDDATEAVHDGKPVAVVFPDADGTGVVIVPNAVMLVKNAPHPDAAKRFIDFLLSADTESALARSGAAQMPLRPGVVTPPEVRALGSVRAMKLDYAGLATLLDGLSRGFLEEWVDGARR